jgi:hypothetical protein
MIPKLGLFDQVTIGRVTDAYLAWSNTARDYLNEHDGGGDVNAVQHDLSKVDQK